jgi:hypothetical protein
MEGTGALARAAMSDPLSRPPPSPAHRVEPESLQLPLRRRGASRTPRRRAPHSPGAPANTPGICLPQFWHAPDPVNFQFPS